MQIFLTSTGGDPTTTWGWIVLLAQKYSTMFVKGTLLTLYIAIIGTLLGFVLGFIVGVIEDIRISPADNPMKKAIVGVVKAIFRVYVEIFRDTPMIVQAMVVYYGLLQSNFKISSTAAGILVTVLNTGAYMSETVRAGINSVDNGQREGAMAIGMTGIQTMIYIVLPQAFKNIIPEMGNTYLSNLKMTSVLNVIGTQELFMQAKTAGGVYYKYFESYLIIAMIYFVLCFVFNIVSRFLESRLKGKADYALAAEYMDADQ